MSFIRIPSAQDRYFVRNTRRVVTYDRIAHESTDEVFHARCDQFRVRLWELGLIHSAILAIDKGLNLTNLNTSTPSLEPFVDRLHVHEPGSIIFAGHSFGSATVVQFLKSVYYAGSPELAEMTEPLFVPSPNSPLRKQITAQNVTILLDMWCFPLLAESCRPLLKLPLPVYADVPHAAGGNGLLAIESDTFFDWSEHLHRTALVLSPEPSAEVVEPEAYERPSGVRLSEPNFFVVHHSAHLNQSDFGILFPLLTKRIFGSEEPERAIRLNLRAMLQVLRTNNIPIARTWAGDLVDGAHVGKLTAASEGPAAAHKGLDDGIHDDKAILDRSGNGGVEAWDWIDIVGMGRLAGKLSSTPQGETAAEMQEAEMAKEIEPQMTEGQAVETVVSAVA